MPKVAWGFGAPLEVNIDVKCASLEPKIATYLMLTSTNDRINGA